MKMMTKLSALLFPSINLSLTATLENTVPIKSIHPLGHFDLLLILKISH